MSRIRFFLLFFASALCFLSYSPTLVFSQENKQAVKIDSKLMRDIEAGHRILEQATEVMSGKISFTRSDSENETSVNSSSNRQFSYYKNNELLRLDFTLDFTRPKDDTNIPPNNENNDIPTIILSTKDYNYRYFAFPTTVSSVAKLYKSKKSNSTSDLAFTNSFLFPVRSLYSLEAMTITDLLKDRIGKIEYRKYESIPDALWIHSVEHVSKTGQSKWTVVLNPEECYALLYYELYAKNNSINFSIETKQKVTTQKTEDGKIFAKEITSTSITNGKPVNEQYVISVDSTSKPDDKVFTEECFKQNERDYVIVDVLPDQKEKAGTLVKTSPLASRIQDNEVAVVPDETAWPWSSVLILFLSFILLVIAVHRKYSRGKREGTTLETGSPP